MRNCYYQKAHAEASQSKLRLTPPSITSFNDVGFETAHLLNTFTPNVTHKAVTHAR